MAQVVQIERVATRLYVSDCHGRRQTQLTRRGHCCLHSGGMIRTGRINLTATVKVWNREVLVMVDCDTRRNGRGVSTSRIAGPVARDKWRARLAPARLGIWRSGHAT